MFYSYNLTAGYHYASKYKKNGSRGMTIFVYHIYNVILDIIQYTFYILEKKNITTTHFLEWKKMKKSGDFIDLQNSVYMWISVIWIHLDHG